MAIIQPLQYQSMFVPTNLNLLNQQIQGREQEYKQNEALMAQAADKYAQVASDPSAIQYKNELLDQFKGDMDVLSDQYGGDLGAIDKRTLINKMNKIRPQIQQLQRHAALKEEERKMRQKLGPFALELGPAEEFEFGEPVMNIANRQDYLNQLSKTKQGLAGQRRMQKQDEEGNVYTYYGLYPNEVEEEVSRSAQELMNLDPRLDEQTATEIASEYIPQLSRGWTYDMPKATAGGDGEDDLGFRNYLMTQGGGQQVSAPTEEIQNQISEYEEAFERYNTRKNTPTKKRSDFNTQQEYNEYVETQGRVSNIAESKYEKARKPFEGPMLNELTDELNIPEDRAIKIVAAEKAGIGPYEHSTNITPRGSTVKETKDIRTRIYEDLNRSLRKVDLESVKVYDGKGGVKERTGKRFEERLKNAVFSGDISDLELDMKDGELILHTDSETSYGIPVSSFGNKGVSESINNYNEVIGNLYGKTTGSSKPVSIGGNVFASEVRFNPDKNNGIGGYDRTLYMVNTEKQEKYPIPEEILNDYIFSSLFESYSDRE